MYWPQAGTVSYGNMYVELVNVRQEEEHIVLHELRLTNREVSLNSFLMRVMGNYKVGTQQLFSSGNQSLFLQNLCNFKSIPSRTLNLMD